VWSGKLLMGGFCFSIFGCDFLGLKDTFLEKDLDRAILEKIEHFLLELGRGFAFFERQKRMVIDGKDYSLNLLFYHRKLKRLIAIDLAIMACMAPQPEKTIA